MPIGGPDSAAMRLDDASCDGESHSGAFNCRGTRVAAIVLTKDFLKFIEAEARTAVGDGDHRMAVIVGGGDFDGGSGRCVLARVFENLEKGAADKIAVDGKDKIG